ncbi:unnamed protein product, partial [Mesorhabditis belari]|uniref:Uncharacterized protein n=1 Tax=Mesorhabditis belari TaxID=2138241 RepID=A0AAF3EMV5_9BILA
MFLKTCIGLIIIGIGLSNGASVGPSVRHFRDLVPTRNGPGPTTMLKAKAKAMCRNFHHFKTDTAHFSKARRHVFVEAEFRLCDVENRPIAEQTLECVVNTFKNASKPPPECEPVVNLELTAPCSDKTAGLMFNCTIGGLAKKCGLPQEGEGNLDRMIDIVYFFETQLLMKPFKNDTCGWKFMQATEGGRKGFELMTMMTDIFRGEYIKK